MGQEIVYCSQCNTRLRSADFSGGGALKIEQTSYCVKCAREAVKKLPSDMRESILKAGKLPVETPRAAMRPPSTSAHPKVPARRVIVKVAGKGVGVAVAVAVAAGVLALIALGGRAKEPPAPPAPAAKAPGAPEILQRARDFAVKNPTDLPGQVSLFEKAATDLKGSPAGDAAAREAESLRGRLRDKKKADRDWLEEQLRAAREKEEFQRGLDALAEARKRYADLDWTTLVDQRSKELQETLARESAAAKEKAYVLRLTGGEAEIVKLQERASRWGAPTAKAAIDEVLTRTRSLYVEEFAAGPGSMSIPSRDQAAWTVSAGELRQSGPPGKKFAMTSATVALPQRATSFSARLLTPATAPSHHGIAAKADTHSLMLSITEANDVQYGVSVAKAWKGWVTVGKADRTVFHDYTIVLDPGGTLSVLLDGKVLANGIAAGPADAWKSGIETGIAWIQPDEDLPQPLGTRFDRVAATGPSVGK